MRAFVALDLPENVINSVVSWQEANLPPEVFPEPAVNLHMTLGFLGETDPMILPQMREVLDSIGGLEQIILSGPTGYKETPKAAFLTFTDQGGQEYWAAMNEGLYNLTGYQPQFSPWLPHITVWKYPQGQQPGFTPTDLPVTGDFSPVSVGVYQSVSNAPAWGATYQKVANIFDPIEPKLDQAVFSGIDPKKHHIDWILRLYARALQQRFGVQGDGWTDLYFTGSLTTYQYSESSDADISVFANWERFLEELNMDASTARKELVAMSIEHLDGTFLPGTTHPLQFFVVPPTTLPSDLYQPGLRSAYSLDDRLWYQEPEPDRVHEIATELPEMFSRAADMAEKMRDMLDHDPEAAKQLFHDIHSKRNLDQQAGLGDFSEGNIVYKYLLHEGLFDRIRNELGVYIAKTAEYQYARIAVLMHKEDKSVWAYGPIGSHHTDVYNHYGFGDPFESFYQGDINLEMEGDTVVNYNALLPYPELEDEVMAAILPKLNYKTAAPTQVIPRGDGSIGLQNGTAFAGVTQFDNLEHLDLHYPTYMRQGPYLFPDDGTGPVLFVHWVGEEKVMREPAKKPDPRDVVGIAQHLKGMGLPIYADIVNDELKELADRKFKRSWVISPDDNFVPPAEILDRAVKKMECFYCDSHLNQEAGKVWCPSCGWEPLLKRSMAIDPAVLKEWIKYEPYAYHETPLENIPAILEDGLRPGDPESLAQDDRYQGDYAFTLPRPGHVYMTTNPSFLPRTNHDGLVRIDMRYLNPDRINADEDFFAGWGINEEEATHIYPDSQEMSQGMSRGQWAELNPQFADEPSYVENSLYEGLIAYDGSIPPEAIEDWTDNPLPAEGELAVTSGWKIAMPPAGEFQNFLKDFKMTPPGKPIAPQDWTKAESKIDARGFDWEVDAAEVGRLFRMAQFPLERLSVGVSGPHQEELWRDVLGWYDEDSKRVWLHPLQSLKEANETLWHEIQHAYQHLEGRADFTNYDYNSLDPEQYRNHPMEQDANEFGINVQMWANLIKPAEPLYDPKWVPDELHNDAGQWNEQFEVYQLTPDALKQHLDALVNLFRTQRHEWAGMWQTHEVYYDYDREYRKANLWDRVTTKVIYDFDKDQIILGTQATAADLPHSKIIGEYADDAVTLFEAEKQWINPGYFHRLWQHTFPNRPLTDVYYRRGDNSEYKLKTRVKRNEEISQAR